MLLGHRMKTFLSYILDILVYGLTGAAASYYFFNHKRRELLGGFWGGAVIGVVGAVIITWLSGTWFIDVVTWMMNTKFLAEGVAVRVNLIAAIVGAFVFVYILNRINHNRERRK